MTQTEVVVAHQPHLHASVERRLQLLILGQELRVEQLELLLSRQKNLEVISSLIDPMSIDPVLSIIQQQGRRPIQVILIDWDGDSAVNMELLAALVSLKQRCLLITSHTLPSDLAAFQRAGAWGCVSTRASSRHLLSAIQHVASGKKSFFPPSTPVYLPRARRQLVFYPERVEVLASRARGIELIEIDLHILAHLAEPTAVEIGAKIDRQPSTIRTQLSNHIFPFLQKFSERKIDNQKIAFLEALRLGIFAYQ